MLGLVPRKPATHFGCYVEEMCEACWFHLRVLVGSCVIHVENSSKDLSDELRDSCWVNVSHVAIRSSDIGDELRVSCWV